MRDRVISIVVMYMVAVAVLIPTKQLLKKATKQKLKRIITSMRESLKVIPMWLLMVVI